MPNNARNHARNSPFPLRHVDFHEQMNAWAHPTHHAKRQLDRYTHFHNDATKSPLVTMGRCKFTPKLPLPLRRSPPNSNTPIPSPTPLTPQTASKSNQQCCHYSHVRTDRWHKRKFYPISAPLIERRANNRCSPN